MGANLRVDTKKATDTSEAVRRASKQLTNNHNEVVEKWKRLAEKTGSTSIQEEVDKLKNEVQPKIELASKYLTKIAETINEMIEVTKKIG